ncbi:unknown [Prevotella sp. CAG:592]|nr:unknown [Prevotella sp. CAG:592]
MILFWIFYRKVSLMYHRSIMPFGIPYFPPRQGEDIPTLGGSVPHGVGEIRGQYFTNYKSMFYE